MKVHWTDTAAGHLDAIYTYIETAKACGLEPYQYLRFLFERLPYAATEADYQALLPQTIEPAQLA